MKTLNATLLTAQATAAGGPIARASIADNNLLHPINYISNGANTDKTAAVSDGTTIVRLRYNVASTKLQYQRITDPTVSSQWTTGWTDLEAAGIVRANFFTIFFDGTYFVACMVLAADNDIQHRRSSDAGITWSGATFDKAFTLEPYIGGCSSDSTHSGIFYLNRDGTTELGFMLYNGATNSFTATLSGVVVTARESITGLWDAANARHVILWIGTRSGADDAPGGIHILTRTAAPVWTQQPNYCPIADPTLPTLMSNIGCCRAKIGGYWYMTYSRNQGDGLKHYLSASDDGVYWSDGIVVDVGSDGKLNVLETLSGYTYLAAANQVCRSAVVTYWSNAQVIRYHLDQQQDIASMLTVIYNKLSAARLLTLRVQASGLTAPPIFSALTLERGYNVAGVDYYRSAGAFFVTSYRWLFNDYVLEITAADPLTLLYLWEADQILYWTGRTLSELISAICARAGVHDVTFTGSASPNIVIDTFTITIGTKGLTALETLRSRGGFEVYTTEAGGLVFYEPAASPASVYTYAGANHQVISAEFAKTLAPNWVMALAITLVGQSGEAAYLTDQAALGHRQNDTQSLTTDDDLSAFAASRLIILKEQAESGQIVTPPNFALEMGDVITYAAGQGATMGPWRVTGWLEDFNPAAGPAKFYQKVQLRGTT